MANVSIRLRLVLTLVLVIGLGGVVQAASYLVQRTDTAALQDRSAALLRMRDLGHELEEVIGEQHDAVIAFLLTGNPARVSAYHAARIEEAGLLGSSEAIVAGHPDVAAALAAMSRATDAWRDGFAEPATLLVQSAGTGGAGSPVRMNDGDVLFAAVAQADSAFDARVGELNMASIDDMERIETNQLALFLVGALGALLGIVVAISLLSRWILRPLGALVATARRVEAGEDVRFAAARNDEIGRLGRALERMRVGLTGQASEAAVVNQFTELTAFVEADGDVARATLDALNEITSPDDGAIHISNASRDRALPEGSLGDVAVHVVSLGQLAHCPGVRRSSLYVTPDLGDKLGVRCPVYPGIGGTLACIPLLALGEVVGAVHLHWSATDALPLDIRSAVTRITEHASLAIANRRLMNALQGMASTDSRTGLPNSRVFDERLQERITNRDPGEPLSVLMLDVDHFKAFNDRNGHPAGDQALRTFARILEGAVREGDLAARYGGEEFVIMLPGSSPADAAAVAERIRARTEESVIDLSPGHRDQITVSVGVATWPADATDRVRLLEIADAALYRAKNAGRNQVVVAGQSFTPRIGEAESAASGQRELPEPVPLSRAG